MEELALEEKRNELVGILKSNICNVTFTKVNGEQRTMPCTLKEGVIPPAPVHKLILIIPLTFLKKRKLIQIR